MVERIVIQEPGEFKARLGAEESGGSLLKDAPRNKIGSMRLRALLAITLLVAPAVPAAAARNGPTPRRRGPPTSPDSGSSTRRAAASSSPSRRTGPPRSCPITYNSSPNSEVFRAADPARTLMRPEAAFQLSIKAKLGQDLFGGPADLWLGYTQKAFWQLYDIDESAPFRTTTTNRSSSSASGPVSACSGFDGRFVQVGLSHQSNGMARPLSRNWNRLVANVGLERGPLSLPRHRLGPRPVQAGREREPGHHALSRLRPGPGLLVPWTGTASGSWSGTI